MNNVRNLIAKNSVVPASHEKNLFLNVKNKVSEISQREVIANSRNKVAAFFKGLLGVLLYIPFSMFVKGYPDIFFKPMSVRCLKGIDFQKTNHSPPLPSRSL